MKENPGLLKAVIDTNVWISVSGDEDLLSLIEHHGTKIVTPGEFLHILVTA